MCCESAAEEEKMEVDHDQNQEKEKEADDEPMETDNNAIEEQQQQQESSNEVKNPINLNKITLAICEWTTLCFTLTFLLTHPTFAKKYQFFCDGQNYLAVGRNFEMTICRERKTANK